MSHQGVCHWKDLSRMWEFGLRGPPRQPPPPTQSISLYFKTFEVKSYRILGMRGFGNHADVGLYGWEECSGEERSRRASLHKGSDTDKGMGMKLAKHTHTCPASSYLVFSCFW